MEKLIQTPKVVTIGADPEFTINKGDTTITYNNIINIYGLKNWGRENSNVIELRPTPQNTVEDFIKNIRSEFKILNKHLRTYSIKTRSDDYTKLGGHIHLVGERTSTSLQSTETLQNIIGAFMRWIVIAEPTENYLAREHYSSTKQARFDWKGSVYTVEYRTASSLWFNSPRTLTTLVTYLLAVHELISTDNLLSKEIIKKIKYRENIVRHDTEFDKETKELMFGFDKKYLLQLKGEIRKTKIYKKHKHAINRIFNPIKMEELLSEKTDISSWLPKRDKVISDYSVKYFINKYKNKKFQAIFHNIIKVNDATVTRYSIEKIANCLLNENYRKDYNLQPIEYCYASGKMTLVFADKENEEITLGEGDMALYADKKMYLLINGKILKKEDVFDIQEIITINNNNIKLIAGKMILEDYKPAITLLYNFIKDNEQKICAV